MTTEMIGFAGLFTLGDEALEATPRVRKLLQLALGDELFLAEDGMVWVNERPPGGGQWLGALDRGPGGTLCWRTQQAVLQGDSDFFDGL